MTNDELVTWINTAPEAERVREFLRPSFEDLAQRIGTWSVWADRYDHRNIMRRKVRRALIHGFKSTPVV